MINSRIFHAPGGSVLKSGRSYEQQKKVEAHRAKCAFTWFDKIPLVFGKCPFAFPHLHRENFLWKAKKSENDSQMSRWRKENLKKSAL